MGYQNIFNENVEQKSGSLDKNCLYNKITKIKKLPQYLIVNLIRFEWKEIKSTKAKILKQVKFPIIIDLYEQCHDDLKKNFKS